MKSRDNKLLNQRNVFVIVIRKKYSDDGNSLTLNEIINFREKVSVGWPPVCQKANSNFDAKGGAPTPNDKRKNSLYLHSRFFVKNGKLRTVRRSEMKVVPAGSDTPKPILPNRKRFFRKMSFLSKICSKSCLQLEYVCKKMLPRNLKNSPIWSHWFLILVVISDDLSSKTAELFVCTIILIEAGVGLYGCPPSRLAPLLGVHPTLQHTEYAVKATKHFRDKSSVDRCWNKK